jgi:hypothetical protein
MGPSAHLSDFWNGSLQAKSVDTGGLDQWSFAGAVDVSPNVSLGASLDYYKGDHTFDQKRVYWSEDLGKSAHIIRPDTKRPYRR